ncbi:Mn2+ and Fe2+ transporters of the NRAMP family [Terribacillus aidingensis]|uniref:Mn2+ and Fe2+ transporters of the NRAMP family n=1 Tax=Terribacillus aidingensis TaxID=586416 RepID=A0A285N1G1_9BACI|nr:NRAMP family divalent metal transporter [Terribacillus aidingensis]SNZ03292.1 Mn2+ and Fe2+ transporters of the NRAMP family [Terribacillus aidingensis]
MASREKDLQQKQSSSKGKLGVLLGAAFLMGSSAVGPGFLTQTAVFTEQLLASFGFVILMSIILDVGVQMNIWRIIAVSRMRGQDIANKVMPGLGYFLAFAVALGGLAFNIGNVGGAGLGLNVIFGMDARIGAVITGVIAIGIFLSREAGAAMDQIARILGIIMIALTIYVAFQSDPPLGQAAVRTFAPTELDVFAIITLVGGTVGGYITFAGGHRLLDAGISGKENLRHVTRSSVTGILIASIMRIFLFLAVLGVVVTGVKLDANNPAASVFLEAAGTIGYKMFGLILWAAGITSVIGAAYTSVSFLKTLSKSIERHQKLVTIGFIVVSTIIMVLVGQPATLLVLAGAVNGLILPVALGVLLIGAYKKSVVGDDYKHPLWLTIFGAIVFLATAYLAIVTLIDKVPQLF